MSLSSSWVINEAVIGPEGTYLSTWFQIQSQVCQWNISTMDYVSFYGLCGYVVYILPHGPKSQAEILFLILHTPIKNSIP